MTETLDRSIPHLVDVAGLARYERNSRTHSRDQIEQIKEAIRRFGFVGVLAYDDAGLAIGHGRQTALIEMWAAGETVMGPGKRSELPAGKAWAIDITGLDDAERRALIIADNKLALNAGWDEDMLRQELETLAGLEFDMPVMGFDDRELERLLNPPESGGGTKGGQLAAEFLIPPFTVLNAREGWWQERKRQWIGLGIQSEIGRGENLIQRSLQDRLCMIMPGQYPAAVEFIKAGRADGLDDDAIMAKAVEKYGPPVDRTHRDEDGESTNLKGSANLEITTDPYRKRKNGRKTGAAFSQDFLEGEGTNVGLSHLRQSTGAKDNPGSLNFGTQDWVQRKIAEGDLDGGMSAGQSGSSIFDPVLCELAYRWFAPAGGVILDPFAGGSVRGIVAGALGRRYVGIDLRQEQVDANREQWPKVSGQLGGETCPVEPEWHVGDSLAVLPTLDVKADMIFSCPPYGDLEIYSDDPADISRMDAAAFTAAYASIISAAVAKLKPDRFACFVVGDYRDKRGIYANFVSATIAAFTAAGAALYNEAILITQVGSLPIRAAKQFRSSRKLGKTHQNVLVFVKGDPKKATKALGPVDVSAAMADVEPDDED